jgi:hypothetical protein
MTFSTSVRLAYGLGPFFLVVDVWRRFGRWHEWPFILDDVIGGALLLAALVQIHRKVGEGRYYLVAAWGYCVGMMYQSFFGQVMELRTPDASGLSTRFVVGVKGVLFALCVLGLIGSLPRPSRAVQTPH